MDRLEYAQKLSKYTALIVDDDEILTESMTKTYRRYFRQIYIANDGLSAIEQYKQYKPDIVISDVTMPKCDGITMAKEIKKLDENLKIIFTSGHNEEEYLKEFETLGNYVTKPIDLDTLLELMLNTMEKK